MKVVGRLNPFHCTVDPLVKFVPLTMSVKAELPAGSKLGLMLLITGRGLLIKRVLALEVPPPGGGLKTKMVAVPALAMSLAGMAAVSCVGLVGSTVVLRSRPFHWIVEEATKFVPITVRVKAG